MTETGPKLAVIRDGTVVTIEFRCVDIETAKAIFAEVSAGARAGHVEIEVGTVPRETIDVP